MGSKESRERERTVPVWGDLCTSLMISCSSSDLEREEGISLDRVSVAEFLGEAG
jgi:hypothetical protein